MVQSHWIVMVYDLFLKLLVVYSVSWRICSQNTERESLDDEILHCIPIGSKNIIILKYELVIVKNFFLFESFFTLSHYLQGWGRTLLCTRSWRHKLPCPSCTFRWERERCYWPRVWWSFHSSSFDDWFFICKCVKGKSLGVLS